MLSVLERDVCKKLSVHGYGTYEELCGALIGKRILLPWCGNIETGCCLNLRYNSGLYTQCENLVEDGYCVSCEKEKEKNGGEYKYGTVAERMSCGILEYKDVRGKGVVSYLEIMKKKGISKDDVEKEALRRGVTIPQCHFEDKVSKRGRPRKEEVKEEGEKKKRGRPRKEKEVVSNSAGDDLIASLLCRGDVSSNAFCMVFRVKLIFCPSSGSLFVHKWRLY